MKTYRIDKAHDQEPLPPYVLEALIDIPDPIHEELEEDFQRLVKVCSALENEAMVQDWAQMARNTYKGKKNADLYNTHAQFSQEIHERIIQMKNALFERNVKQQQPEKTVLQEINDMRREVSEHMRLQRTDKRGRHRRGRSGGA
ncbi:hypothetical protein COU75_02275 [Candidatus Peregrinibacteria bacterium CG10_big_fil_rev_8_21_14_0_10_42_8]|nr:MAG: hypothetical protein COU75_02275 [Candidatus Peregrinibacteria bacterium CG10_big_fil_rev_8_21_14_0_10_42_8]